MDSGKEPERRWIIRRGRRPTAAQADQPCRSHSACCRHCVAVGRCLSSSLCVVCPGALAGRAGRPQRPVRGCRSCCGAGRSRRRGTGAACYAGNCRERCNAHALPVAVAGRDAYLVQATPAGATGGDCVLQRFRQRCACHDAAHCHGGAAGGCAGVANAHP